jgi:hypothetical protein
MDIEKINQIAESIKIRREKEIENYIHAQAFGRLDVKLNNEEKTLWLVPEFRKDDPKSKPLPNYDNNEYVRRDSRAGEVYVQKNIGVHQYLAPGGYENTVEIFNKANYEPENRDNGLANNILIIFPDDKKYSYQNILEIIEKIISFRNKSKDTRQELELVEAEYNKVQEDLLKAKEEKDIEAVKTLLERKRLESEQLRLRLEESEKEVKKYLDGVHNFIRQNAQLRWQPILDPVQDKIKRMKIFDGGTLIIDGGPGTGKTTSLIQRIKFLISNTTIFEEYKTDLNKSQKEVLSNQNTSWVFFSPSNLLALFLRNAMIKEDLHADDERVRVWDEYKNELFMLYKLDSKFEFYFNENKDHLFSNNSNVERIIKDFEDYYLNVQKEKLLKAVKLDTTKFDSSSIINKTKNRIISDTNFKNRHELIAIYRELNINNDQIISINGININILKEYSDLLSKAADNLQILIKPSAVSEISGKWMKDEKENENTEDEDDEEDEENEEERNKLEDKINRTLKKIIEKIALKQYESNIKFAKRENDLLEFINEDKIKEELLGMDNSYFYKSYKEKVPDSRQLNIFQEIGQKAFYKKHFGKFTKGMGSNILGVIPSIYKAFRKERLEKKDTNLNLELLSKLAAGRNKAIHPDEQALMLYFINTLCYSIAQQYSQYFKDIEHPFIVAYKDHCKPVIAIDEATDFPLIDLLAMNSLRHPEISSVTLSGDLMQRMTSDGIKKWEEFANSDMIFSSEVQILKKSYRQSPTLLILAQKIYQHSTGIKAEYESYLEHSDLEPKPKMIISGNSDEKIRWIADKIKEIKNIYHEAVRKLPSIAVFVPKEDDIDGFVRQLNGILMNVPPVQACREGAVLGNKAAVRVFSIDKIKGLEFEAVFFYNLDSILGEKNVQGELILKYLYVGLSRATFYLGLTLSQELPDNLKFITENFEQGGDWK